MERKLQTLESSFSNFYATVVPFIRNTTEKVTAMIIRTPLFRMIAAPLLVLVAVAASPFPGAQAVTDTAGTIAYVSGDSAIHLIQPDGSQDHTIWTEPASGSANFHYDISDLAWRPDARELAFASNHE